MEYILHWMRGAFTSSPTLKYIHSAGLMTRAPMLSTHAHTHTRTHTHTHAHTHAYTPDDASTHVEHTHAHTRTRMHARIHT